MIRFKGARYEGDFTPLTTDPTIIYPGWSGGMNWGSVSINEDLGIMTVNDINTGSALNYGIDFRGGTTIRTGPPRFPLSHWPLSL